MKLTAVESRLTAASFPTRFAFRGCCRECLARPQCRQTDPAWSCQNTYRFMRRLGIWPQTAIHERLTKNNMFVFVSQKGRGHALDLITHPPRVTLSEVTSSHGCLMEDTISNPRGQQTKWTLVCLRQGVVWIRDYGTGPPR